MRANVTATLASTNGVAVVAGIARSTVACVLCGHPQGGSNYSVCPDCNAANPQALANESVQRLLRNPLRRAEFERFPRVSNLRTLWSVYRQRNRPELAFRIAEYVRSRTIRSEKELSPAERESARRFTERVHAVFASSDTYEWLFNALVHGFVPEGESEYVGDSMLERCGFDEDRVRDALIASDVGEANAEDESVLADVGSLVEDMLSHPSELDSDEVRLQRHEERVEEFLARNAKASTLDSERVRTHRVFVGIRYRCGTYSYGMQRTDELPKAGSSRGYAQQRF